MRDSSLCPGCFTREGPGEGDECPRCGYTQEGDRSPLSLPANVVLTGRYRIGRILGEPGGFGVTYLGFDQLNEERVAVKEYVPREIAGRDTDGRSVVPYSSKDREEFKYGLERFTGEAEVLARFDHANIVSVRDFFEAHGTAYLVMDYYEGKTLKTYLNDQPSGRMDPEIGSQIMIRVLDGLRNVHAEGYLHRDIKPSNIYLTKAGRPILIDFGAARQAMGERSRSLSVVMTEGYAPYEQYRREGDQGPHTDVYGCGATLYRMVTGQTPPSATDRVVEDTLEPPHEAIPEVSEDLGHVIEEAVAPGNKQRPQTAEALQSRLREALAEPETSRKVEEEPEPDPRPSESREQEASPDAEREVSQEPSEAGDVWNFDQEGEGLEKTPTVLAAVLALLALGFGGMAVVKFAGQSGSTGASTARLFRGRDARTGVYATQGLSRMPSKDWSHDVGGAIQTTPALVDETLYLGTSKGRVYALNANTGKEKWVHHTGEELISSPVVRSGVVCLGGMQGGLYALERDTGYRRWTFETDGPIISSPVVVGGTVLVGSGDEHLYAVRLKSGEEAWRASTAGAVFSSPAVVNETVYVGTERGYLYAFDVETGNQQWRFEAESGIAATPAVHGGTVYVRTRDGILHAVDADRGTEDWSQNFGAAGTSSPAVAEGRVVVGGRDGTLRAYATADQAGARAGEELWTHSAGGSFTGSPAIAGETIYVPTRTAVVAVNASSGQRRWRYNVNGKLAADPIATNDRVYATTRGGGIIALK